MAKRSLLPRCPYYVCSTAYIYMSYRIYIYMYMSLGAKGLKVYCSVCLFNERNEMFHPRILSLICSGQLWWKYLTSYMRYLRPFWDFTQRRMVSFLPTFRNNLSGTIFKGQSFQVSHLRELSPSLLPHLKQICMFLKFTLKFWQYRKVYETSISIVRTVAYRETERGKKHKFL